MTESPAQYEFLEHTADIIARAYGGSRNEAFAAAGAALFDVITDSADIVGRDSVAFEIESIDTEGLLVGLLSELIVLHEVEDIVLTDFVVAGETETQLMVTAKSEPFDPARHGEGTPVKGISYHMLEIGVLGGGRHYVQVLFDI